MNRTTMFSLILAALAALCLGCSSASAQCPGGRCASVGVWSPWGGAWYYASPCAGGKCQRPRAAAGDALPAADAAVAEPTVPEEPKVEEPEIADTVPELVEFQPFCLRVAELINAQRAALGLPALELDAKMCDGCDLHSRFMARSGFQHAYYGGRECIAFGVTTPEAVVRMWLNSSGHRAIILGSGKILGVGCSGSFWTLRVR